MKISGNEARLFEIKEDTVANQFTAPAVVPPTYRTILDLDGNTIQYVGKSINSLLLLWLAHL